MALHLGACTAANQSIVYQEQGFSGEKYRCIVVPPFENLSRTGSAGLAMADFVAQALQSGPYKVINRQEVQLLNDNTALLNEGLDPGRAIELGKRLGADAVVIGTVSDYWYRSLDAKPEITLNLRIVDVWTEKVVYVTTGTHRPQFLSNAPLLLTAASKELADELARPMVLGAAPRDLSSVTCGASRAEVTTPAPTVTPAVPVVPVSAELVGPDDEDELAEPAQITPAVMTPGALKLIRRMDEVESFVLDGLNFDLDKTTFKDERYQVELENLGLAMQARPNLKVRLDAHTDGLGDPDFNRQLTVERANLLKAYLISNFDIAPERIETVGHGGTQPLLPNINRKNREANRRVELTVLQGP